MMVSNVNPKVSCNVSFSSCDVSLLLEYESSIFRIALFEDGEKNFNIAMYAKKVAGVSNLYQTQSATSSFLSNE
ncbi:hypothetical protein Leryth_026489 [Lithospermum erythrorhizon]|nr:hypothetical protein Leryth_026489 [Lithospermum erythrorhizon]